MSGAKQEEHHDLLSSVVQANARINIKKRLLEGAKKAVPAAWKILGKKVDEKGWWL